MYLLNEMASRQDWFFLISLIVIVCCFFVITASNIIGRHESNFGPIIGFMIMLICVGLGSILIDFSVMPIIFDYHGENFFSMILAYSFEVTMILWAFVLSIIAIKFAKQFKVVKNKMSATEVIIMTLSIFFIMSFVVRVVSTEAELMRHIFLREILFVIIPGIATITSLTCLAARKLITEY